MSQSEKESKKKAGDSSLLIDHPPRRAENRLRYGELHSEIHNRGVERGDNNIIEIDHYN